MNQEEVICEFLSRIEKGYYQVINGRLHRKGKPLGTIGKNGYLSHSISVGRAYAHRILFAYYNGIDSLMKYQSINHKDGNKLNNSTANLEGMSLAENSRHQRKTGLSAVGSDCTYALLNEYQVKQIKKLLELGVSQFSIAEHFGVHRSTILGIHNGSNWKRVEYSKEVEVPDIPKIRQRSDRLFNDAAIRTILKMNDEGMTRQTIANEFGVSRALVNRVVWGRY